MIYSCKRDDGTFIYKVEQLVIKLGWLTLIWHSARAIGSYNRDPVAGINFLKPS